MARRALGRRGAVDAAWWSGTGCERLESRTLLDGAPIVRITVAEAAAAELPRRIGEFELSRTGSILLPLTVHYQLGGTAVNGVDFTPLDAKVTIPAGRRSATLPIIPIDDVLVEGDEVASVTLLPGADYALDPTGRGRAASLTITDDDSISRVTVHAVVGRASEVGRVPGWFEVRRSGATDLPLVVRYTVAGSAAPGTDYEPLSGVATIRAHRSKVAIAVRPSNDAAFEGDEVVRVTLLAGDGFTLSPNRPRLVSNWVVIEDRPTVTIGVWDPVATTHPSDGAAFILTRTGGTDAALSVAYTLGGTAVPGTDFGLLPVMITIPAGRSTVLVNIRGRGNRFVGLFRTVQMTLRPSGGYNLDLAEAGTQSRGVVIWDDGQGPVQGA